MIFCFVYNFKQFLKLKKYILCYQLLVVVHGIGKRQLKKCRKDQQLDSAMVKNTLICKRPLDTINLVILGDQGT